MTTQFVAFSLNHIQHISVSWYSIHLSQREIQFICQQFIFVYLFSRYAMTLELDQQKRQYICSVFLLTSNWNTINDVIKHMSINVSRTPKSSRMNTYEREFVALSTAIYNKQIQNNLSYVHLAHNKPSYNYSTQMWNYLLSPVTSLKWPTSYVHASAAGLRSCLIVSLMSTGNHLDE